jgi:hypothetical protein
MLTTTNDSTHSPYQLTQLPKQVTPPQLHATSPSFFRILCDKIYNLVSKIFACITCKGIKTTFFNAREIKLLRDDRLNKIPLHEPALLTFPEKEISIETSQGLSADITTNSEPPYTFFCDQLEELRLFIREFSVLGINVIYENYLASHIESTQTLAPSLQKPIKSIAKLVVEIGDKAAKPLYKKFSEQKAKIIDPTLQKLFKTLIKADHNELREKLKAHLKGTISSTNLQSNLSASDYIDPLLDWFCTNEDQRKPLLEYYLNKNVDGKFIEKIQRIAQPFWDAQIDAEERKLHLYMEEQLCEEFKDARVPSSQNIDDDYIKQILTWLLLSNRTVPLNNLFGNVDRQKEELIDNIFERAITLLVERKIDQYSGFLEKTIQGHLDTIIQRTLQKNAIRITDFFSERFSELITSMKFTKLVNELIHDVIHQQIQAVIESQKAYKEAKEFLKKIQPLAQITPDSIESLEAKILAQNHLHSVEIHGGKKAYLERMQLLDFSKHRASTAYLQQVIKQELELVQLEKDPTGIRRAAEKALYNDIAENLLNLMMPVRKKLGSDQTIEEIDPFIELWNRLYLPEEFYNVAKQCEQLTQEFVTPETIVLLEKIKLPTIEIVKNLFKSSTKDLFKKKLVEVVQNAIEKITIPEKINEVSAEICFTAINLMLIETFCRQELGRNLAEFIPLFHQLATNSSKEKDEKFRLIQNALIKMTKSRFIHFNPAEFACEAIPKDQTFEMQMHGISPLEWLEITRSIINDIDQKIQHSEINQQVFNPQIASQDEVGSILKEIFSTHAGINNPEFGKFTMNLIFGLGEMDSEWLINFFLKNAISSSITESVEPWHQSYHKAVGKIVEKLKKNFLDPNAVKALFTQESPKQAAIVKAKLDCQIQSAAAIAHDLIMSLATEKGSIQAYLTKKILTEKPKKLNGIITKIYKKLFQKQLINQNLAVNACDKIFQSLKEASEFIRIQENMRIHQMT